MNSYDDLQRFKEKTQTNHIDFKDMSEQSLNPDSTNWAIIKQLLSDGAETVLDKSQRIDVVAPQPIDPAALTIPPPAAAAPAQPIPSFTAVDRAAPVGGSLLDSISSSLKPAAPAAAEPNAPAAEAPAAAIVPAAEAPTPAKPVAPLVKMVDLRPESVAQSGSSLFEQLAQQQAPSAAQPQLNALLQPQSPPEPVVTPQPSSVSPQLASQVQPNPLQQQPQLNVLLQSPPVQPQAAWQPSPQVAPQPAWPQQQPVAPQPAWQSQPSAAPQPAWQSQPSAAPQPAWPSQPSAVSQPAWPSQPFAAPQAAWPPQQPAAPQPAWQPQPSASQLFTNPQERAAAASSNISYKQLFSPAGGPADRTVSKEMPLQSLLEKIASCR